MAAPARGVLNRPMATSREEWARSWPLPLIAMLGISGPAAYAYTGGIFMAEMTGEFGWSKTQFSTAMTLQMAVGLIVGPLSARVLDRIGSRRMLLVGPLPFVAGLSMLGTASGSVQQWWLLGVLYAVLQAGVISAAWVNGVVQSFDTARGMAIAVCLTGIGLATVGWPLVAARLVEAVGWRLTFPAMAAIWLAIVYPLIWLGYKPASVPRAAPGAPPPAIGAAVRTRTFWFLVCAGGLFSSVQFGLIVHLFPTVRLQGLNMTSAAAMVSITGVFSIIGRLGTGALLDRLPTKPLALFAFLLPLAVMALFLSANGSLPMLIAASALLGFAAGSEIDVVAYLCSRRFDRRIFGTVYTLFQMTFAISSSFGPLLASWRFDRTGAYDSYYAIAAAMVLVASGLIALLPSSAADPAAR